MQHKLQHALALTVKFHWPYTRGMAKLVLIGDSWLTPEQAQAELERRQRQRPPRRRLHERRLCPGCMEPLTDRSVCPACTNLAWLLYPDTTVAPTELRELDKRRCKGQRKWVPR